MAEPNTPIPFTVGDQERLVSIETTLKGLCENFDPALVERVGSLESSRKRWHTALSSVGVLSLMALISAGIAWLFGGGR